MAVDLSDKLQAYANRVVAEVKRPLKIEVASNSGGSPFKTYADANDRTNLHIMLSPDLEGWEKEQSIAHELTHWLLWARGFKNARLIKPITDDDKVRVNALSSMIDDIAVHKIQDAEGFGPFNRRFIPAIKNEISLSEKGISLHASLTKSPTVAKALMAYSYIIAWSSIEYHELDDDTKKILREYLQAVRQKFNTEYNLAISVRRAVKKYDVFNPEGHSKAFVKALGAWGLTGKCDHVIIAGLI